MATGPAPAFSRLQRRIEETAKVRRWGAFGSKNRIFAAP